MQIFAYTWNTHGILQIPTINTSADLYLVSLQECTSPPELVKCLPHYSHKRQASLYGLQTVVLSRNDFKCRFIKLALGPLFLPNKGCIATVINGTILHINVHLSAHPEHQPTRMGQIQRILELVYRPSYDTVILAGDFNFRMVDGVDQGIEFSKRHPLFRECAIRFGPTYKYDGASLSTKRTPSYCDRIYAFSHYDISFMRYESGGEVLTSDHKPVYCELRLGQQKKDPQFLDVRCRDSALALYLSEVYQHVWENRRLVAGGMAGIMAYFLYTRIEPYLS